MNKKTDTLYRHTSAEPGSFRFDQPVVDVFDDMINRSVPSYQQIVKLIPTLTRSLNISRGNYYDLGCSTGTGLASIHRGLDQSPATLIGIDSSQEMAERARNNLRTLNLYAEQYLEIRCADINNTPIRNAAMVLMNFTLQFIPIQHRDALLTNIYQGMLPSGALVLSEKLKSKNPKTQSLFTRIHHQYKIDQGYTELEISNKRDAIENVLIPETLDTHIERLRSSGFKTISPWVRDLQFVSILAMKE